jgi:hypothetical protein
MVQIGIPEDLFECIKRVVPDSVSPESYVVEVLRENLAFEERKRHFYRLSDQTRAAMMQKGISEADILEDFESFRETLKAGHEHG